MRLHLTLAVLTALALVITFRSNQQIRFTFAHVQEMAEQRSHSAYVPLPNVLPPQLKNLTPEQEDGIFWNDAHRLWRNEGLPFQVDFYHVSKSFPYAPKINTVDAKGTHTLKYTPTFFRFSGLQFNPPLPDTLGYAGFYLRYPINKPDSLDSFFSFQGASYFRVVAKDQVYGLPTRGVSINTAVDGKKEEFPNFCEWWLQQPAANASEMVLDALLDGPSVTGAYEFKVRPGAVTSVDVHVIFFFRQAVDRVGIAPLTSMYLFGENAKDHFGDNFHPEIHDSDGLLINKNNGEWMWRPLEQEKFVQLYPAAYENPRGFGLIQRDRDFQHYLDTAAKYNIRPSAYVTPKGDWGKGVVQLIQLPTNNTNTDNVVLFWTPEKKIQAGDRLDLSYTVDYYMNDANRPPLAYATQTLVNDPAPPPLPPAPSVPATPKPSIPAAPVAVKSGTPTPPPARVAVPAVPSVPVSPNGTTPVQFVIDFFGDGIDTIAATDPPHLDLTCTPPLGPVGRGTFLNEHLVEKKDKSWRVSFTIIPFKHDVPTDILCRLTQDKKPITETWTYTWHQ
jgi:glucans biosynthesis protein